MILVTGASGFLGSAVVRLALRKGLKVRAMVRESSSLDLLPALEEEALVRANMADPDSLDRAVDGVEAVVHCAATTSQAAPDLEKSRQVNVEGTRALLEACARHGVKRFINISSQSAHSGNSSVYGQTKREQDEVVQAGEPDWTILKPSIIYGAEAKGIFDKMVGYCRKLPVIPIIGPGREEMRPVHVDDVAAAALSCLEKPESVGQTYDIGGADAMEFNAFIEAILKALGQKKPFFHLPIPVALAIAHVAGKVMANPPLTPDNVKGIQTAPHVDIRAARRDLDFQPRSFAQGLRDIWKKPDGGEPVLWEGQTPFRLAVIGLGKMGVMHASMATALPGVEVAAVVDRDSGLGGQIQSMGVDAPFYDSVETLLEKEPELDGVIIATPQFTHREVALACLKKGLHVLCEKPLAHNLEDARSMAVEAWEYPEQIAAVAFMKGHDPLFREAADRLREGWIGQPKRFRATMGLSQVMSPKKGWTFTKSKAGGGVLINSGIHLVHFLQTLFGKPEAVCARGRSMHSRVEDSLCALLEYETDLFGSFDISWSLPGYATEGTIVLIEGEQGVMEITDNAIRVFHLTGKGEAAKGWSVTHRHEIPGAPFNLSPDYFGDGYYFQVEDFVRAARQGGQALYDWNAGLDAQKTVDALYRSMESREREQVAP